MWWHVFSWHQQLRLLQVSKQKTKIFGTFNSKLHVIVTSENIINFWRRCDERRAKISVSIWRGCYNYNHCYNCNCIRGCNNYNQMFVAKQGCKLIRDGCGFCWGFKTVRRADEMDPGSFPCQRKKSWTRGTEPWTSWAPISSSSWEVFLCLCMVFRLGYNLCKENVSRGTKGQEQVQRGVIFPLPL